MRDQAEGGVRPEAVLAVLLILSVLLIIFSGSYRENSGREWGSRALLAVQRVFGRATGVVEDGVGSLKRFREIRMQYESALERLSSYQSLERDLVDLRRENEALKKQLGFSAGLEYDHISARVIAGDPSNIFATLTIDKGTNDGVRQGMAVTAFQDGFFGLVGKVVTSSPHSAQVRPINAPGSYVAARFQNSRYEGLIEGQGQSEATLIMHYVRKSAGSLIAVNDLVLSSGMNSLYPPGIYIGRVEEIRSREYDTSLELIVNPIIDESRLEYIFVLKNSGKENKRQ